VEEEEEEDDLRQRFIGLFHPLLAFTLDLLRAGPTADDPDEFARNSVLHVALLVLKLVLQPSLKSSNNVDTPAATPASDVEGKLGMSASKLVEDCMPALTACYKRLAALEEQRHKQFG
jgi:hypothetical protein